MRAVLKDGNGGLEALNSTKSLGVSPSHVTAGVLRKKGNHSFTRGRRDRRAGVLVTSARHHTHLLHCTQSTVVILLPGSIHRLRCVGVRKSKKKTPGFSLDAFLYLQNGFKPFVLKIKNMQLIN